MVWLMITARPRRSPKSPVRTRRPVKPVTPGKRVMVGLGAVIMLAIGIVGGVSHAGDGIRRFGWMGQPGRLTVTGCDTERGSRGSVSYTCYGDFVPDSGTATPMQSRMDDSSTSQYRFGKKLRVTSDGHGTVSPVGFGYALHAWAELLFFLGFLGGIGVLLLGTTVSRPEGRWFRVSWVVCRVGLGMMAGGLGLALLLAIITLF